LELSYTRERELRGTAGALKLAGETVQARTLLVLNGDSFFDVDLTELVRHHDENDAPATVALAWTASTDRFGAVQCGTDGAITHFLEKEQTGGPAHINAGVYVFDRSLLDWIPEGCVVSLERDIFPRLIGHKFYGRACDGYFVDIGTPESCSALQSCPQPLVAALH
jgi:NDP-sugar pyrophosphorylase family protein